MRMRINPARIVFAPKRSKVGIDQHDLRLDVDGLKARYRAEGKDPEPLFASDAVQREVIDDYRKIFPKATFLSREELVPELLAPERCDLVVSLGGDNHFTYVARFVGEDVPILGINTDPQRSTGALLSSDFDSAEILRHAIEIDRVNVEFWPRIVAMIGDNEVATAINDIYIGEKERYNMSRHRLFVAGGIQEEQRGSGLLVTTGAGSTGWYLSAGQVYDLKPFERSLLEMRFLLTEGASPVGKPCRFNYGSVASNGEIGVTSLNDAEGVLVVDSIEKFPLPRGAKATLKLRENSLRVVI